MFEIMGPVYNSYEVKDCVKNEQPLLHSLEIQLSISTTTYRGVRVGVTD